MSNVFSADTSSKTRTLKHSKPVTRSAIALQALVSFTGVVCQGGIFWHSGKGTRGIEHVPRMLNIGQWSYQVHIQRLMSDNGLAITMLE